MESSGIELGVLPGSMATREATRAEIASSDGQRYSGNHRPAMQTDTTYNTDAQAAVRQTNGHLQPSRQGLGEMYGSVHSSSTQNSRTVPGIHDSNLLRPPEPEERRQSLHPPEAGSREQSVGNGRVQSQRQSSNDSSDERRRPHRLDFSYRRTIDSRGRRLSDSRIQPGLLVTENQPRARSNEYHELPRRTEANNFRGVSSATTQRSRGMVHIIITALYIHVVE